MHPHRTHVYLSFAILTFATAPLVAGDPPQTEARSAPLFEGMGDHHHSITTDSELAQRYFDQGLVLAFGFNHAEAERSFREAAAIDPQCAMAWWGAALVLGPNINAPMPEASVPKAWEALQQAIALKEHASEKERAYIDALAKRYAAEPMEDRTPLDQAYAEAMRDLAQRFSDDLDAKTLYAEAIMDTMPWDYWRKDGQPKDATKQLIATLDEIIARNPRHSLANHLYIHAVEAGHPEQAEAAADRLGGLVPGSGHLVHMPSHIYIRVGRYHDGAVANERAIEADEDYVVQCHAQGLYPLAYMPHNHHFLSACATFEGRKSVAIKAALHMMKTIDQQKMREDALDTLQHFWVTPLFSWVRFGEWDEILAWPEPDSELVYPRGVRHYARAIALIRKGDLEPVESEITGIQRALENPALDRVKIFDINSGRDILGIALEIARGELAFAQGDHEAGLAHARRAVELESELLYDEPPSWHHPVRQILGSLLIEAGKPAEAERAFREDLVKYPDNGWSLFGLAQSLEAQGKTEEAQQVRAQFEKAWQRSEVELISARF